MSMTLTETTAEQDWRNEAHCRDIDPDLMQPEVASPEDVEAAMAVCAGCPVRLQCRELAESQSGTYGVHDGRWYGDPPRHPTAERCGWCEGEIPQEDTQTHPLRSTRTYCSTRCRVAAHRARQAVSA